MASTIRKHNVLLTDSVDVDGMESGGKFIPAQMPRLRPQHCHAHYSYTYPSSTNDEDTLE